MTGRPPIALCLFAACTLAAAPAPERPAPTLPTPPTGIQAPVTPYDAMMLLQAGNERFASGRATHPNTASERRAETAAQGQKPFAVVLACADSRVPVEQIFDRGVGDIFVVRVAGNVCDVSEAASIEYGLAHLHAPLLVVLGHSACGAVTAAAAGGHADGPISTLLHRITPAVDTAKRVYPERSPTTIVPEAIRFNVWKSIEDLLKTSAASRTLVASGKVKIVGGVYDMASGRVQWMGEAPTQAVVLSERMGEPPALPSAVRKPIGAPTADANPKH